jgi:hypothetical protein
MSSNLHKRVGGAKGGNDIREAQCPPEAYEYDDDVTPEAIAQLRAEADEILSKGKWTTIEGYVGINKQNSRVG